MSRQSADLPQYTDRLVENAELSEHRPPVVVDFPPSQTIFGVERVHTAKRELDAPRSVVGRPRQPPRCAPRMMTSTTTASSAKCRLCTRIFSRAAHSLAVRRTDGLCPVLYSARSTAHRRTAPPRRR